MALASALYGEVLKPVSGDAANFFPYPDEPAEVVFEAGALTHGTKVDYAVYNYEQEEVDRGSVEVIGGYVDVPVELEQGYYEIHFPESDQAFGVIALPDYPAVPEGYWCIDAGLTWSKWSPAMKTAMVRLLNEKGIRGFRERLSWLNLMSGEAMILEHGDTAQVRDEVYRDNIGEHRILELFQDSPASLRRDPANPFSIDLGQSYSMWQAIAERYVPAWSALELWNEPFFVKGLPADQYVPVAKMVAAAVPNAPVVAGCFSPSISVAYLDDCAQGGLLDVIDAMTLHLYGPPESMPKLMQFYRDYLRRYGRSSLPVWVSESGDPGSMGEFERTTLASERQGTMRTVMRAIECKVYGVQRFYTFYLQKHIEGVISWGMTDAYASPQRKLAAVLYAAQTVGDLPLLGDLDPMPEGAVFGHVFGDGEEAVVVLYAPDHDSLDLPFTVKHISGIDGRALVLNADQSVPVPDGIVYLRVPSEVVAPFINTKAEPMEEGLAAGGRTQEREFRTLVVQPEYIRSQTEQVSNLGYFLNVEDAENYRAAAYISNLSPDRQDVRVSVEVPGLGREEQSVSLEPLETRRVEWTLDLSSTLSAHERTPLTYRAQSDTGEDAVTAYVQPQPATRIYSVQKSMDVPRLDGRPTDAVWKRADIIDNLECFDDNPSGDKVSSAGLEGVARFLWGDVGLYFLIEVKDDAHEPPENAPLSWKSDSVQIAFHQQNSSQDINDFEWGFFLDQAGNSQRVLFRSSSGEELSEATRVVVVRDEAAARTVYEGVISWLDLGSMKAINDRTASRFRLSFIINDANTGHRRWLEWSPGIAKGKTPTDYPELILVNDKDNVDLVTPSTQTAEEWDVRVPGSVEDVRFDGVQAWRIADRKGAGISTAFAPLKMERPLCLSFRLGVTDYYKNNGTGFCFMAVLWNKESNEGYECWVSPDRKLFADQTGFALADHDGTLIDLGEREARVPPDGKLHKITLWIDPATRILKLYLEIDGENKLIAQGVSKRNVVGIDGLEFSTSGWGSGDLILADISLRQ
jgi:hypothetical protein